MSLCVKISVCLLDLDEMLLWIWGFCFWTLPRRASWTILVHHQCHFMVTAASMAMAGSPLYQLPPPGCLPPQGEWQMVEGSSHPPRAAEEAPGEVTGALCLGISSCQWGKVLQAPGCFCCLLSGFLNVGWVSLQCVEWMRIRKCVLAELQQNNARTFQVSTWI